jgi:hypothetical protein
MAGQGGLGVFRLALEAVGDSARNVFNADRGGSRGFFGGPSHHGLQGDGWIVAAEAHQHVLGHRLGQSATFLLDEAADSILQMGYLCRGRIKEGDRDAIFGGRAAGLDGAEAEGSQDGIRLAQEAPDTLCITSMSRLEILQPLPGDGQLLHLPLLQLLLPRRQSGLLVPQTSLPGISIELASQDLDAGVLESFTLPIKLGLTSLETGLTGTQSLELAVERDPIQLLPLQQPPLQLFHLSHPLVDLARARSEILLLLDDDDGAGLGRGVQLLHIGECAPGVGVEQFDGLCLQVEATLTPPRLCPLGSRGLLEHGGPQLEALALVGEIPVFPAQHTLHLRQDPESRAYSPI